MSSMYTLDMLDSFDRSDKIKNIENIKKNEKVKDDLNGSRDLMHVTALLIGAYLSTCARATFCLYNRHD